MTAPEAERAVEGAREHLSRVLARRGGIYAAMIRSAKAGHSASWCGVGDSEGSARQGHRRADMSRIAWRWVVLAVAAGAGVGFAGTWIAGPVLAAAGAAALCAWGAVVLRVGAAGSRKCT